MKFTVLWQEDAERELVDLWLSSASQRSVTEAANRIDAELRRGADTVGEGRSGIKRILLMPPLGVVYEVSLEDR